MMISTLAAALLCLVTVVAALLWFLFLVRGDEPDEEE